MKKLVSFLLMVMLVLTMTAGLAEDGRTVTDMTGRTVALPAEVKRVVVLQPGDVEILCAIGAEDTLVGRGQYCDYPAQVLELPAVDSGAETNVEQIIALSPDVVVMTKMSQTVEQNEALEKAGIPVVVTDAQTVAQTYDAITLLGTVTGKDAEAAALVDSMKTAFDGLTAEAAGKTVYFEVSPLEYGLWTAGKGTFMDELATMVGLTNAFADVDGWAEVSAEQVLARDPDYIVTTTVDYGTGVSPVEEIESRKGWEGLKAIVNGDVFNADTNTVSRPGPRLVDAARELSDFIQGVE